MMSKLIRIVFVMLVVGSGPAAAQAPAPAEKAAPQKATPAATPKPATDKDAKAIAEPFLPINVRIELTITDQRGDGPPVVKAVSMIASDKSWSRIRTSGDVRTPMGVLPVILNVDARPWLFAKDSNRARVELTIEYRPSGAVMQVPTGNSEPDKTTPNINESLSVVLDDAKPMLISQSADPVTDRRVKVEVKATILR
jgi:hypothetical protein